MPPTVFRESGFRFYFFSREEARPHVHVQHATGEAKFWLEPAVSLADNQGLSDRLLRQAECTVATRRELFLDAWCRHFGNR